MSTEAREFSKVVRDPIHDYVGIPGELLPLVDHPFVQRLRRISQTAMSSNVYPSMTGRRFEHSLGAMHLAYQGWGRAWRNTDSTTRELFRDAVVADIAAPDEADRTLGADHLRAIRDPDSADEIFARSIAIAVAAAALLHDIGHSPFSHTLEEFYKAYLSWIIKTCTAEVKSAVDDVMDRHIGREFHEQVGLILMGRLEPETYSEMPWSVTTAILESRSAQGNWAGCLHDLISGEVDFDRLDYLIRDTRNSGTEFGAFDKERLLQSIEIKYLDETGDPDPDFSAVVQQTRRWVVGFNARASSALETFITNRYQYYRWVVYHYHTVAANRILNLCLFYLLQVENIIDDKGELLASATAGAWDLNYFAASMSDLAKRNRELANADDGTVLEWVKQALRDFGTESASDPDMETARKRFVCLAESTLHRTANWVPMWKTRGAYFEVCEGLFEELKQTILNIDEEFTRWAEQRPAHDRLALSRRKRIQRLRETFQPPQIEGQAPPQGSVPFTDAGPIPLMNAIARMVFGTGREVGALRFIRELNAADHFSSICGPVDAHPDGFWIFAFNSIRPWLEGDEAAQVFRGEKRGSLAVESGHMLHRLETVESERPQFHCYFVSPRQGNLRRDADIDAIRAKFTEHFPRFAYDALHSLFCRQ